jgi:hypothetical protein
MPKDPLQAEGISTVNQVPHTESMTAGVGMQLGDGGNLLNPLKYFFDRSMGDGKAVCSQKNKVIVLWIC